MPLLSFTLFLFIIGFSAQAAKVELTYSPECILQAVAARKKITLDSSVPIPAIHLESKTSFTQYQDAVESQWKIRLEHFLNIYVVGKNEIYLLDDESNYNKKFGRFIDDSLAHELTHYLQVKYDGSGFNGDDDALEAEATRVQHWFRETYMATGRNPCH